ncbi:glycoside hydrolase family 19 protein [Pseudocitrobacter cyperus]|uniref:Glycoside hydrolase family 19 protein n=1 Tax=Pseudocitrobacter cyperus TaxID=3112843 RepID=A0ABV0HCK0_9ENTR
MSINRHFFFDHIRAALFQGSIRQSQLEGIEAILDKWEKESPHADDRWLAYMLGTVHHETGHAMQPVRETFAATDEDAIKRLDKAWHAGKLTWVTKPYWRPDADGKSWYGRGFVQLTHKTNYEKLGKAIHSNLTSEPDKVMVLDTALEIMFVGMQNGLFTSHRLADFFNDTSESWVRARKIINGLESADRVAGYAKTYYAAISYTVG